MQQELFTKQCILVLFRNLAKSQQFFAGTFFRCTFCIALTSPGCDGSWLRTSSGTPCNSVRSITFATTVVRDVLLLFHFKEAVSFVTLFSSTSGECVCSESFGHLNMTMSLPSAGSMVIARALPLRRTLLYTQ